MTEHEEPIDDIKRRRRVGERGLSPGELLGTLIDSAPTEGDVQMLMELRVGLAAEGGSGPAARGTTSPAGGPPRRTHPARQLTVAAKCSLQRARADGPADDGVAASAAAHDVKFLVGPATVRALFPAFPVSPGMAGHIRFGRRVGDECLCVR